VSSLALDSSCALALIALFGAGLVAAAGRHLSQTYLVIAGAALALVASVLAIALVLAAHPDMPASAARRVARVARHVRSSIDPEKAARTSKRLASLARSALTGRAFVDSFGFVSADLLFDLLSLDLMFCCCPVPARFRAAGGRLRCGEHGQRPPHHARRAGRGSGHAGGDHRRFRHAAANCGARRARLPDRELLAAAASRSGGLLRLRLSPKGGEEPKPPRRADGSG
jgi:hypothetical protein